MQLRLIVPDHPVQQKMSGGRRAPEPLTPNPRLGRGGDLTLHRLRVGDDRHKVVDHAGWHWDALCVCEARHVEGVCWDWVVFPEVIGRTVGLDLRGVVVLFFVLLVGDRTEGF